VVSILAHFPRYVWAVLFVLAGVAAAGLFASPSVTEPLGFLIVNHIIVTGVTEFGAESASAG
jgi:hypothetical protein